METNRKLAIIVFSKNRAMQLNACLRSLYWNIPKKADPNIAIYVLYNVDTNLHLRSYWEEKSKFVNIHFIPEKDFHKDLLYIMDGFENVMFCTDDTIFKNQFSPLEYTEILNNTPDAIGFSLRLGKNITYCYPHDAEQSIPRFQQVDGSIIKFPWIEGKYDFGYPMDLSSSIYRTADIFRMLENHGWTNSWSKPNYLESFLDGTSVFYTKSKPMLLCESESVAYCNPVNVVQTTHCNRNGEKFQYSPDDLCGMFLAGDRIDIMPLMECDNISPHEEVELKFFKGG
jgi:hypothetical protein